MGYNRCSFRRGEGGRRKGVKNKKTRILERWGLRTFEEISELTAEGLQEILDYPKPIKDQIVILGELSKILFKKPK